MTADLQVVTPPPDNDATLTPEAGTEVVTTSRSPKYDGETLVGVAGVTVVPEAAVPYQLPPATAVMVGLLLAQELN
jgi:hypothetical protein